MSKENNNFAAQEPAEPTIRIYKDGETNSLKGAATYSLGSETDPSELGTHLLVEGVYKQPDPQKDPLNGDAAVQVSRIKFGLGHVNPRMPEAEPTIIIKEREILIRNRWSSPGAALEEAKGLLDARQAITNRLENDYAQPVQENRNTPSQEDHKKDLEEQQAEIASRDDDATRIMVAYMQQSKQLITQKSLDNYSRRHKELIERKLVKDNKDLNRAKQQLFIAYLEDKPMPTEEELQEAAAYVDKELLKKVSFLTGKDITDPSKIVVEAWISTISDLNGLNKRQKEYNELERQQQLDREVTKSVDDMMVEVNQLLQGAHEEVVSVPSENREKAEQFVFGAINDTVSEMANAQESQLETSSVSFVIDGGEPVSLNDLKKEEPDTLDGGPEYTL